MKNNCEQPDYTQDSLWVDLKKKFKIGNRFPKELLPLFAVTATVLISIPLLCYYRMYVATIDVILTKGGERFEIPSVPKFYDLRNPRSLKLYRREKLKPAIHLDNRYRLMRHEPMLDAEGNKTDVIGDDETTNIDA